MVVALDIGGTHVTAGRVALSSATVERHVRLTLPEDADRRELLDRVAGTAAEVADGAVSRVGIAVPGPFDYANGICLVAHKLEPIYGVDLRHELAGALGLPGAAIAFVNDADAFLLGEWWAGAAVGRRRAVGVTLGTGLGSAFLEDGRIVDAGPRVPPEGSLHLVSYRGLPAEATISRAALLARYGEPELDVRELATLARGGEARARLVFAEVAGALGELIAPWLASFDATCLVVGGSIARAWDLLEQELRETLRHLDLQTIAPAARLDEAALLGAARHAANASAAETP